MKPEEEQRYSSIYCLHCDKYYNASESTAEEPIMFCSKECEQKEDERLKEGNEIIKTAVLNDPAAALQMGLGQLYSTEHSIEQEKAIFDIVDRAFLNMNKSGEKK